MFFNPLQGLFMNTKREKKYSTINDDIDNECKTHLLNNNLEENVFTHITKQHPLYPGHTEENITHYVFSGSGYKKRVAPVCHFTNTLIHCREKVIYNDIYKIEKVFSFEISYDKLNKTGSLFLNIHNVHVEENGSGRIKCVVINDISIDSIALDKICGYDSCITTVPMEGISSCYRKGNINKVITIDVMIEWSASVSEERRDSPKLTVDYYQSSYTIESDLLSAKLFEYVSRFTRAYQMDKKNDTTYTFNVSNDIVKRNKLVNGFLYNATVCLKPFESSSDNNDREIYLKELTAYVIHKDKTNKEVENVLQNITGTYAQMNYQRHESNSIKVMRNKQYKGYTMNFTLENLSNNIIDESYIHTGSINLNTLLDDVDESYQMYIEATFSKEMTSTTPMIVLEIEGETQFNL